MSASAVPIFVLHVHISRISHCLSLCVSLSFFFPSSLSCLTNLRGQRCVNFSFSEKRHTKHNLSSQFAHVMTFLCAALKWSYFLHLGPLCVWMEAAILAVLWKIRSPSLCSSLESVTNHWFYSANNTQHTPDTLHSQDFECSCLFAYWNMLVQLKSGKLTWFVSTWLKACVQTSWTGKSTRCSAEKLKFCGTSLAGHQGGPHCKTGGETLQLVTC